tara:strand:+ start:1704 stop:2255 length:552 start_codon:yes stop_codon:yes gene_type:complete
MSSNKIGLIILACVSFMLSLPKIQQESLGMIILTIAVGYSVTKNIVTSVSVGLILGAIFTSLTSVKKTTNVENFKSGKSKKKKHKNKKRKNDIDNQVDTEPDDNEHFEIDGKTSFVQNMKSLGKKETSQLKKDTKELLSVQKQLIETLKDMGPTLENGREIMATFQNYFGSDNMKNMNAKLNF